MSEYWKSTPKYWCKHCKTYVRDSKLERRNHEATPRHQGNLQRFLRGLHKDHEREEREKQRAKQEVDRLNGVNSASPPALGGRASAIPSSNASSTRQATPAERKAQLQQLAAMGVAVPEDFRREMAMPGEWSVQSQRIIEDRGETDEGIKKEEDDEDDKKKVLNIGVRKRKHEGQEEEEAAGERVVRKGWGSTTKAYPGATGDDDLDALLRVTKKPEQVNGDGPSMRSESSRAPGTNVMDENDVRPPQENNGVFHTQAQEPGEPRIDDKEVKIEKADEAAKPSLDDAVSGPVFKKRKSRPMKAK